MRAVYDGVLQRRGRAGSDAEFDRLNGPTLARIVALVREWHELTDSYEALFEEYAAAAQEAYRAHVAPLPDAVPTLRWAGDAGYHRALVTSTPRWLAGPIVERLGWDAHFDAIVCGDDVSEAKPSPDVYRRATELLGVEPQACIAIEDAPAGVRSALAAGVPAVGVNAPHRHAELRAAGAVALLTRLTELRDWVETDHARG